MKSSLVPNVHNSNRNEYRSPPQFLKSLFKTIENPFWNQYPPSKNTAPVVPFRARVLQKEVEVQFGPGVLGFGFGNTASRGYTVHIRDFQSLPNGKPSRAQMYNASTKDDDRKLTIGMFLTHINQVDVNGMPYYEVIDRIQQVGRPVSLRFAEPKLIPKWSTKAKEDELSLCESCEPINEIIDIISRGDLEQLQHICFKDPSCINAIDSHGRTPLHHACHYSHLVIVEWLLNNGGFALSMCFERRTALHYSAESGNLSICKLLESNGVNPHSVDLCGISALHIACINNNFDVLEWLTTECKVNIHMTTFSGKNLLHYACYYGHLNIAKWLVHQGVNISSSDGQGWTNLHYASNGGQMDVCQWLVFHGGVHLRSKNKDGKTASEIAKITQIQIFLDDISRPPPAPKPVKFSSSTDESILLEWEPIHLEGPSELERYQLQQGHPYLGKWKTICNNIDSQATRHIVSNLKDKEVIFRLRGKTANGWGAYSNRSTIMRPELFPGITVLGRLLFHIEEGKHFQLGDTIPDLSPMEFYCVIEFGDKNDRKRPHYRIRTPTGGFQQKYSNAWNVASHPKFKYLLTFEVWELETFYIQVQVYAWRKNGSQRLPDTLLGWIELDVLDLVRGLPVKYFWKSLKGAYSGEILLASLFLPNHMNYVLHPNGNQCRTVDEWMASEMPIHNIYDEYGFQVKISDYLAFTQAQAFQICHDKCQRKNWLNFHIQHHQLSSLEFKSIEEDKSKNNNDDDDNDDDDVYRNGFVCENLNKVLDECKKKYHDDCIYMTGIASSKLKELIWKGIPKTCRSYLYMKLSGGSKKKELFGSGYFEKMVKESNESVKELNQKEEDLSEGSLLSIRFKSIVNQIEVDLDRTFSGNKSILNTIIGQRKLRRVLLAYAQHNQNLGYCQSMNFIAGRLLCILDEESTFYILICLCEEIFPKYYIPSMQGLRVDSMVFHDLLKSRLPKLSRHFHSLSAPVELIATPWLLTIFCNHFPSETTYRILDCLLLLGSELPFAIILAHLRIHSSQLLQQNDYLLLNQELRILENSFYDVDYLLNVAKSELEAMGDQISLLREKFSAYIIYKIDPNIQQAILQNFFSSMDLNPSNVMEYVQTILQLNLPSTLNEEEFCKCITKIISSSSSSSSSSSFINAYNILNLYDTFKDMGQRHDVVCSKEFCLGLLLYCPFIILSDRIQILYDMTCRLYNTTKLTSFIWKELVLILSKLMGVEIAEFNFDEAIEEIHKPFIDIKEFTIILKKTILLVKDFIKT